MEQKIFEKEYSIPYELFEKAFTQWQKKFVYPKTYTISILFLAVAVVYIISAVRDPSSVMAYVMTALCLGLSAVNWYNPKKIKRSLLETVRTMSDELYRMTLYDTFIEISTVIPAEDSGENTAEKEIFGDDPPETVESSKLYFNNGLKILEYDEYFIAYQVKELFYIIPKSGFSDGELEIFRKKNAL